MSTTRMILVTLKRPVKLPICLLDAIREGGIKSIRAGNYELKDVKPRKPPRPPRLPNGEED